MNNQFKMLIIFITGFAAGSAVTWKFFKKKTEIIIQEESDPVDDIDQTEKDIVDYSDYLHEHGYTNYSDFSSEDKAEVNKNNMNKPYIISPEEFGDIDEYEKISLTYYADQILADENDGLIENIDDVVGFDSLSSFGEYEDDSVFVRNDRLMCDYEILLDQRKYMDVIKSMPREVDD